MNAPTKACILDIDGVLVTPKLHRAAGKRGGKMTTFDPVIVKELARVLGITQTQLVIISSWRMGFEPEALSGSALGKLLNDSGLVHFLHTDWCVPKYPHTRAEQLSAWLRKHPEIKQYAILDDGNSYTPEQVRRLIKTTFEDGLQPNHLIQLTHLLS